MKPIPESESLPVINIQVKYFHAPDADDTTGFLIQVDRVHLDTNHNERHRMTSCKLADYDDLIGNRLFHVQKTAEYVAMTLVRELMGKDSFKEQL